MFSFTKQIRRLYANNIFGCLSLTGAWVAILAARGFSLAEIGLAETCYHIASLLLEIPSGALADVLGRKRMLTVSVLTGMAAGAVMILSGSLAAVCLSITLFAAADSFSSGTGDALAFDSMKLAGREEGYPRYESDQLIIFRLCDGLSTLCAGFALLIGHRIAYAAGLATGLVRLCIIAGLKETDAERRVTRPGAQLRTALKDCFRETFRFLRREKRACLLMTANSLVGAADTLLLFFLQAKLPRAGVTEGLLGPLLLIMSLGGIIGARLSLKTGRMKYRTLFLTAACAVAAGVLLEHTAAGLIMAVGGFLAAMADDMLQVRTNSLLQGMFPSEQRATLISVECFTFSVIMIVLSPLAGLFFNVW